MHNLNNITKIMGATILLVGSSAALAETLTIPATVSVDNTIDFAVTGSLDFGIIRATADNSAVTTCVGLVVPADPTEGTNTTLGTDASGACTTGAGNAVLESVGGTITRPAFTIAGLAPFTSLNLTLPSSAQNLELNPAPALASVFQLLDFTGYQTSGTPGSVTTAVVADGVGDIAFSVGATIITDPGNTNTGLYQNAAYTGDFDVIVTY